MRDATENARPTETTGAAAARVCGERRFEVTLVDVGIRNPEAELHALALRGRRLQRAVILFSDGTAPTPVAIVKQGTPVVAVKDALQAGLAAWPTTDNRTGERWSSGLRLS